MYHFILNIFFFTTAPMNTHTHTEIKKYTQDWIFVDYSFYFHLRCPPFPPSPTFFSRFRFWKMIKF